MAFPLSGLVGRRAQAHIRHLAPVPPGRRPPLVARVYAQVERDFGMAAPPVVLHAPAPEALAACWLTLRETLLVPGAAGRAVKEVVAAAVSLRNACPYCVDVHTTLLHGLIGAADAAALAAGGIEALTDPVLRGVAAWARATGNPREAAGHGAPFPAEWLPELVGVVATFEYLNRMVDVFLPAGLLPRTLPAPVRRGVSQLVGRLVRSGVRGDREPGASLDLLPAAPLPEDLGWAAPAPAVAGAFARAAAAFEAAGRRAVPGRVRELVLAELAAWDGVRRGPGRAWAEEAVARLPAAQRPAGRFALLVALASYQVGPAVVAEFRRAGADDRTLVETAAWAGFAAARHVAAWAGAARPAPRERTTIRRNP